jgi:thioredoxin reductase (NADPH)
VVGGQIVISDWIENYPGFPEGLSGPDLVQRLTEQAKRFGLHIENNEAVSVDLSDPVKTIVLNGRSVTTHTIVIATGASPRKLGVPGEETFYGNGVSSCATCDAPLFKDRIVAAVGGGDTAVKEALFLTKLDENGFIVANLNMETSVPGVFAAGDVRNTPLRQIATAVGDGAVAAFSAGHYIENLKK